MLFFYLPSITLSCYFTVHRAGSQLKIPVPRITKQTKSHSLNFNVLSSVIDSSGEEVWVSFDSDNYFYVKTWFE